MSPYSHIMRLCSMIGAGLLPSVIVFATSIKIDGTPLRSGCASDTSQVSILAAGTSVTLRFAVSGESVPCYKVVAEVDGKRVDGYLPASAIEGLDTFDHDRKSAAWIDVKPSIGGVTQRGLKERAAPPVSIRFRGTPAALHVKDLLEKGKIDEALAIVDSETKRNPDAGLLALAGVAAMESDQNRRALDYFKASLDLEQDPGVDKTYKELLREYNADQSITKLYGVNVVLRFDSNAIPVDTARHMLNTVDQALLQVSQQLGCRIDEKIITIAQSWESYKQARGAVEWSGGLFDGRIRVPMEKDKPLNAESSKTLTHEATHACLSTFGTLPQWLHEGLAQKLSGETLPADDRKVLAQLAHEGKLISLNKLGKGWGGLSTTEAKFAYAEALLAVDLLVKEFGNDGVRNLLRNPERIPAISAELDKRLAE